MEAAATRLARITVVWQRAAPVLTSTWFVGVLVAAATWNVGFGTPVAGLDTSWVAGLYMATHAGLHFGSDVIWTYGPLGFLAQASVIYRALGVIWFAYMRSLADDSEDLAARLDHAFALLGRLHPASARSEPA